MTNNWWLFLFFSALLLLPVGARAQPPVVVANPNEPVNLAPDALFLEDENGTLTLDSVQRLSAQGRMSAVGAPVINFGITEAAFWLKLKIQNGTRQSLALKLGNPALHDIWVYEQAGSQGFVSFHSGNWQRVAARHYQRVMFLFPLQVPPGAAHILYLRVQHQRGTQFTLQAGTLQALYQQAADRDVIQGIYFGFMLLMVLYNLFLYFSLRDASYIYYVFYVLMMGLLNASINGYTFRFLWPSLPVLNQYEDVLAALSGITGILFANSFLSTKENVPFFYKLFRVLLTGYLLVIVLVLAGYFTAGSIVVEMLSVVLVLSFFVAAFKTLRRGYKPARFFLIAWTLLLISVIVFILKDFNLLPYNTFTVSAMQIGSAVEAVLLSMALANKIKVYKMEKEAAQTETLRSLQKNEQLIKEQNLLLEKRVQERTIELQQTNRELTTALQNLKETQAQLVQKEKMASLGELTAGIAHEIQNPLNFVNNFSELDSELFDELGSEIKQGHLRQALELAATLKSNQQKILLHGRRADNIVKNMLELSRAQSGRQEPVNLNALVDEYLQLAYHGIRAKDSTFTATFQTHFDDNTGQVNLVPQDIGRVLLNLFNNAFYSVREKKQKLQDGYQPKIAVYTHKTDGVVSIGIRDNGMGISPQVRDKIYQPFFTTKPTGEGTGLGLSLSYDIITRQHGGSLRVETQEGQFAEFIIELPAGRR